jgi:hypothetical protein
MVNNRLTPAMAAGRKAPRVSEGAIRSRRSRTRRFVFVAAAAMVAIAIAGAVNWRREIAAAAIAGAVTDAGFAPGSLVVEEIGLDRLVIADLAAGSDPAVTVRRLTVDYAPAGLVRRRIERLEVDGASLRLGAASHVFTPRTPQGLPGDDGGGWTVGSGRFADLTIAVEGGEGATLVAAGGEFRTDPDGRVALTLLAPLEIRGSAGSAPLTVRIDPTGESFAEVERRQGRFQRAALRFAVGTVTWAQTTIPLADADAEIRFGETPSLDLRSLRIGAAGTSPLAAPLSVRASATVEAASVPFAVHVSAADGKASAEVAGTWERESGRGRATVTLAPVRFAPGVLAPGDLAPTLALPVSAVTGTLAAEGTVAWEAGAVDGGLEVRVADGGFRLGKTRFSGIAGRIRFDHLTPLRTPPGQRLTVRRIETGVALSEAAVRFRLDEAGRLRIEEARVDALGGRLSQTNAIVDPAAGSYHGVLVVENLAVQPLIEALRLEGAAATGRLGGSIPLAFANGRLTIEEASLTAQEPGVLRYTPNQVPAALQAESEGVSLALRALTNFHYQALRLTLNGRSGEEWTGLLHVAGHNPEVLGGQPFVFNINVSGDIESAVMSGLLGLDLPERLERRLRRR